MRQYFKERGFILSPFIYAPFQALFIVVSVYCKKYHAGKLIELIGIAVLPID